ncbi:MAG TPA: DUF4331 family protein [Gemmatimonadaceae bacterium]|nr:DUF4331 family protein [Gemmatimonadaceae bacterium]
MFVNIARFGRRLGLICAGLALAGAACGDDNGTTAPASTPGVRTFDQVQRLGNPLVSEVLLTKRDHPLHGAIGPSDDVATFAPSVKGFIAQFRPQATTLQNTLAAVLLPDMLVIQTDKAASTAGWLSWALANGWGGRKLTDDAVGTALTAAFSDLLDPTQAVCKPGALPLCTDNVGPHSTFSTTFPYLASPK